MKRRWLVFVPGAAALSGIATPAGLRAQTERVKRVGVLSMHAETGGGSSKFWGMMKERGWEVGRNLVVVRRSADGVPSRLPALAQELVAERVDVILAIHDFATAAVAGATRSIPIVMQSLAPVDAGVAKSLARPGGNVTGLSYMAEEFPGKQIDLLRTLQPDLRRMGIVWEPNNRTVEIWHRGYREAADRAGISLIRVPFPRNPAGLDETLASAERERVQAIEFGLNYSLVGAGWQKIRSWAVHHKVLTSSGSDSGAMVRFGTNVVHFTALFADQLDRVLRGTNPADLPILQSTRFDLVIDRGQLREMGLTVPRSVLLQATEVID